MSISSLTVGSKIKYKIVLLGDQYCGKTAIIDRFINQKFQDSYNPTIGIDFLVKNVVYSNKTYRLQLWDTAGQERFKSLIPSYLKDSNCALIVFDVNSQKSLQNVNKWYELYNQHKQKAAFSVIVGNKIDLPEHSCTDEMIQQQMTKLKLKDRLFKISAKSGDGVQQLFRKVVQITNDRIANTKIIQQIQERQQQSVSPCKVPRQSNQHLGQQSSKIVNSGSSQKKIKLKSNKNQPHVQVRQNCC